MLTKHIPYEDAGVSLEGFAAYPDERKRPGVILCHAWRGRDEFICEKAELMAKWGYVGFAIDMYGKGVLGKSKEENAAYKKPFIDDRQFLLRRLLQGYQAAKAFPSIDASRLAIVGYGFGGICALDLARSGTDLRGAVSIYGHFDPPSHSKKPIVAKILVLHGYNDPIANQDELHAFEREMNEAKADWQVHLFSNTVHAFATPSANDPSSGILYNPTSAKRADRLLQTFLEEIL